jgi:hypothetical protein
MAQCAIRLRQEKWFRGAFVLEQADQGTRFTAELELGLRLAGAERLLDMALRR